MAAQDIAAATVGEVQPEPVPQSALVYVDLLPLAPLGARATLGQSVLEQDADRAVVAKNANAAA